MKKILIILTLLFIYTFANAEGYLPGSSIIDDSIEYEKITNTAVETIRDTVESSILPKVYTKTNLQTTGEAEVNWSNIFNKPNVSSIKYVSSNGNDSTGDGSIEKPFATAQRAYNDKYPLGHPTDGPVFDKDRKSTRLNSSHTDISRMPSSA